MELIREKREAVIRENNTAQQQLITLIENLPKSLEVLEINEELHGDLDFSVIRELEMGKLNAIVLNKGEITSIIGIPDNIERLECPDNYVTSIENLPSTLKILNISHNYLDKLDVGGLTVLDTLNVSHNRIEHLEKLPATLTTLLCNNNELGSLNLDGLINLKTLNISNNPITLVENMSEGVVQFTMENTPSIEFRNSALDAIQPENVAEANKEKEKNDAQKKNYDEALSEFFRLKNEYEVKLRKMKRDAYRKEPTKKLARKAILAIKPACIHCKRPVGTIFSGRVNKKYTVLCGDSANPCELNIQIFNGGNESIEDVLYVFREHLEDIKENIIRQKLNTVFDYVAEENSIALFKKELETYNSGSVIYKEMLDVYNDYFHNAHKKEMIQKKNQAIFKLNEKVQQLLEEYVATENPHLLTTAVTIQMNEIYPEIRNRRLLENEVVELQSDFVSNKEIFSIFKYPIEISKLDYYSGEKPRVIKYVHN